MSERPKGNCTFYSFKPSGKYYEVGRGTLTKDVFSDVFSAAGRRQLILKANDGKYPGLSTDGSDMVYVVIADANVPFGWPLMLHPAPGV